ncbi:hypothetical protein L210DRAFT_3590172, partial [Boletus edulis BED1]
MFDSEDLGTPSGDVSGRRPLFSRHHCLVASTSPHCSSSPVSAHPPHPASIFHSSSSQLTPWGSERVSPTAVHTRACEAFPTSQLMPYPASRAPFPPCRRALPSSLS